MSVSPIPQGFHSLTPYLVVKDAKSALTFYQQAFNAVTTLELNTPDGSVAHAEMKIGNSYLMITEEYPDMGFVGPETLGGAGVSLMLYTEDVDLLCNQAIDAGCELLRPVIDQFYGDRAGTVKDPYGHVWTIGTHTEDLTDEELSARMLDYMKKADE
ncbi:VOC family protein [Thalassotalea atypica]|uniref:VOC family protein n=1 Tax=Thalassotalea atypica TaxID=2054316 RepID=UPI002572BF28|nr:VOC family protein [Thalassotalea atypica]